MLLYNKALDPFHCYLRISCLISLAEINEIEEDRLRILDFIMANPSHVASMSLGKDLVTARNTFKAFESDYNRFEPRTLFESMRPIQQAVISSMTESGIFVVVEGTRRYKINAVVFRDFFPEEYFFQASIGVESIDWSVLEFIKEYLLGFELLGPKGLKYASKLMEYRYDVI